MEIEPWLKPINSRQWQQPLQDRAHADQHHKQFEKICQTTVIDELFDGPKADCANDNYNQDTD
jgi:hypothetical protein